MKSALKFGLLFSALVASGAVFYSAVGSGGGRTAFPVHGRRMMMRSTADGEFVTERRTLPSFTAIQIPGSGKIRLRIGDESSVILTGPRGALPSVETSVRGDKLVITQTGLLPFASSPELEVVVPSLEQIQIDGSADLIVDGELRGKILKVDIHGSGSVTAAVETATLEVNIVGSGDLILSGRAESLELKVLGSGDMDASELAGAKATVSTLGSGDTKLGAFDELAVRITGSGDVSYGGKPRISRDTPGSGRLIAR